VISRILTEIFPSAHETLYLKVLISQTSEFISKIHLRQLKMQTHRSTGIEQWIDRWQNEMII
jgi:hypothetical protein